jgi:hypothetical protein
MENINKTIYLFFFFMIDIERSFLLETVNLFYQFKLWIVHQINRMHEFIIEGNYYFNYLKIWKQKSKVFVGCQTVNIKENDNKISRKNRQSQFFISINVLSSMGFGKVILFWRRSSVSWKLQLLWHILHVFSSRVLYCPSESENLNKLSIRIHLITD